MPWEEIKQAIGLAEGGVLRSALDLLRSAAGVAPSKSARDSAAFTIAVISLAAKLAKADGVASDIEAQAFELIFQTSPGEAGNVRRVYDLAKQDVAGFESYASQINTMLAGSPDLKRDVLECLFMIAAADGIFHGAEEAYLERVAEIFGLAGAEYRRIRALFVRDHDDPYAVLGVDPGADDETLARRHRELVREMHPDRMIARGLPPEYVAVADRKLAAINAAYDEIRKERAR